MPAPVPRPLLVTADPQLLDDVLRLAAAVDTEVHVERDVPAVRDAWMSAPVVLVGADLADRVCGAALPRRDGVVVVSHDLDDAAVWRRALELGAFRVAFLPDAEEWVADTLADAADRDARHALVVGVAGGRGGAGASTLATALAVTGPRLALPTVLLDADPLGGGLDLLLGAEAASGLRWPDVAGARGRVNAESLREALPRAAELAVLSWDRSEALTVPPSAMRTVLSAVRRGHELVVVDLPRRLDDAVRPVLDVADTVLLVVPAEVRATAAAARVAAELTAACADVRVVVRGTVAGGLEPEAVAGALGLPLAGRVRTESSVAAAAERGEPPARRGAGSLGQFAQRFLQERLAEAGGAAA